MAEATQKQSTAYINILWQDTSEFVERLAMVCFKKSRTVSSFVLTYVHMYAYVYMCVHDHVCIGTFMCLDAYVCACM